MRPLWQLMRTPASNEPNVARALALVMAAARERPAQALHVAAEGPHLALVPAPIDKIVPLHEPPERPRRA